MSSDTSKKAGVPLYEALAKRIRDAIIGGDFRPGQKIGSEHGLAREENLSRVTVRKASELLVQEGLLERRAGKGLFVATTSTNLKMIQVVAGNLRWESSLRIARGVQVSAQNRGVQVQLYDAHGDMEMDLEMLRRLPDGQAQGAVIVSLHSPSFSEVIYSLKTADFPFVLVDQQMQDIEVSDVTADNYGGGHQIGEALLEAGHRQIAFIGDMIAMTVRDRLDGVRDAIAEAGLPLPRSMIADIHADQDRLADFSGPVGTCVQQIMNGSPQPTAIVCSCDAHARSAYRALADMGLSVPGDVSVVGFDDDPLAEWLTPPLTTVRQPFDQMGHAAMELLGKRVDDPSAEVEHRVLPVELVRRASLAPPRTSGK